MAEMKERDILSTLEIAMELGVSPDSVRRWIRLGLLPAQKVGPFGKLYRISREDLLVFQARYQPLLSRSLSAVMIEQIAVIERIRDRAKAWGERRYREGGGNVTPTVAVGLVGQICDDELVAMGIDPAPEPGERR